jgi:poly(hydroxyalkanoate) granule-associated protein
MTAKPNDKNPESAFRDSASQIWQAGLGAFAKAQEEGGKVFEALVREGQAFQHKTQAATGEKLSEAAERMASMAGEFQQRATGQWGKLEGIFEERVAQALKRLGVPSEKDLQALANRVAELERALGTARPSARRAPATKAPARKATAKKTVARKTT